MPSVPLVVLAALALGTLVAGPAPHTPEQAPPPGAGTYAWPVQGEVIRPFDPPGDPFGSGHRGVDIAAPSGTPVRAAEEGVVTFAGALAGSLYVSIDHPGGVRTTYSWLSSVVVRRGDRVARLQVLGATGPGHPGDPGPAHLHLGARVAEAYVDPLLLLEPRHVAGMIHLAPLDGEGGPGL